MTACDPTMGITPVIALKMAMRGIEPDKLTECLCSFALSRNTAIKHAQNNPMRRN